MLSAGAPLLRPDDYHPALEFSLSANIQKAPRSVSSNIRRYNLKKMDYSKLSAMLSNINWSCLDTDISINDAVNAFNANIISAFPSCCPTYKPNNSPDWSDSTLRSLKRDRNRTLRNY